MTKRDLDSCFVNTYSRKGPPFVRGEGAWLWDSEDRKYLDFTSGIAVNALGHSHPEITAALKEYNSKPIHISNLFFAEPQIELASGLVENSFGEKVFFCNSGTEAAEAAVKFCRRFSSKRKDKGHHILSFKDGFHGRTYGALSATPKKEIKKDFGPFPKGFHYAEFNSISDAEKKLKKRNYAAVVVEPVQGETGYNLAEKEFLQFLRGYTAKNDIVLVFDEIQCGMGRSGKLWSYQYYGVTPDMMLLAKPLGGGLPLGAVVTLPEFVEDIKPGDHGTTFGGNPLACTLGSIVLKKVSDPSFLSSVQEKGGYLRSLLNDLKGESKEIKEITGTGLMQGIRTKTDVSGIIAECREEGLLVVKAAHNTLRFIPPLNVAESEIDRAVSTVKRVLKQGCN